MHEPGDWWRVAVAVAPHLVGQAEATAKAAGVHAIERDASGMIGRLVLKVGAPNEKRAAVIAVRAIGLGEIGEALVTSLNDTPGRRFWMLHVEGGQANERPDWRVAARRKFAAPTG